MEPFVTVVATHHFILKDNSGNSVLHTFRRYALKVVLELSNFQKLNLPSFLLPLEQWSSNLTAANVPTSYSSTVEIEQLTSLITVVLHNRTEKVNNLPVSPFVCLRSDLLGRKFSRNMRLECKNLHSFQEQQGQFQHR